MEGSGRAEEVGEEEVIGIVDHSQANGVWFYCLQWAHKEPEREWVSRSDAVNRVPRLLAEYEKENGLDAAGSHADEEAVLKEAPPLSPLSASKPGTADTYQSSFDQESSYSNTGEEKKHVQHTVLSRAMEGVVAPEQQSANKSKQKKDYSSIFKNAINATLAAMVLAGQSNQGKRRAKGHHAEGDNSDDEEYSDDTFHTELDSSRREDKGKPFQALQPAIEIDSEAQHLMSAVFHSARGRQHSREGTADTAGDSSAPEESSVVTVRELLLQLYTGHAISAFLRHEAEALVSLVRKREEGSAVAPGSSPRDHSVTEVMKSLRRAVIKSLLHVKAAVPAGSSTGAAITFGAFRAVIHSAIITVEQALGITPGQGGGKALTDGVAAAGKQLVVSVDEFQVMCQAVAEGLEGLSEELLQLAPPETTIASPDGAILPLWESLCQTFISDPHHDEGSSPKDTPMNFPPFAIHLLLIGLRKIHREAQCSCYGLPPDVVQLQLKQFVQSQATTSGHSESHSVRDSDPPWIHRVFTPSTASPGSSPPRQRSEPVKAKKQSKAQASAQERQRKPQPSPPTTPPAAAASGLQPVLPPEVERFLLSPSAAGGQALLQSPLKQGAVYQAPAGSLPSSAFTTPRESRASTPNPRQPGNDKSHSEDSASRSLDSQAQALRAWVPSLMLSPYPVLLSSLSLSGCGLTMVPREVAFLPSLTSLDLSLNQLGTGEDPHGGMHHLAACSTLRVLNLSGNSLTSLSPGLGRLRRLRQLLVNNNPLAEVPVTLRHLHTLQLCDFHGTRMKEPFTGMAPGLDSSSVHIGNQRLYVVRMPTAMYNADGSLKGAENVAVPTTTHAGKQAGLPSKAPSFYLAPIQSPPSTTATASSSSAQQAAGFQHFRLQPVYCEPPYPPPQPVLMLALLDTHVRRRKHHSTAMSSPGAGTLTPSRPSGAPAFSPLKSKLEGKLARMWQVVGEGDTKEEGKEGGMEAQRPLEGQEQPPGTPPKGRRAGAFPKDDAEAEESLMYSSTDTTLLSPQLRSSLQGMRDRMLAQRVRLCCDSGHLDWSGLQLGHAVAGTETPPTQRPPWEAMHARRVCHWASLELETAAPPSDNAEEWAAASHQYLFKPLSAALSEATQQLQTLAAITHINLSYNYFPSVPPSLLLLRHLKTLIMVDCGLTSLSHPHEEEEVFITAFPHLHTLNVARNCVAALPMAGWEDMQHLRRLYLEWNMLRELPLALLDRNTTLPRLAAVSLGNNPWRQPTLACMVGQLPPPSGTLKALRSAASFLSASPRAARGGTEGKDGGNLDAVAETYVEEEGEEGSDEGRSGEDRGPVTGNADERYISPRTREAVQQDAAHVLVGMLESVSQAVAAAQSNEATPRPIAPEELLEQLAAGQHLTALEAWRNKFDLMEEALEREPVKYTRTETTLQDTAIDTLYAVLRANKEGAPPPPSKPTRKDVRVPASRLSGKIGRLSGYGLQEDQLCGSDRPRRWAEEQPQQLPKDTAMEGTMRRVPPERFLLTPLPLPRSLLDLDLSNNALTRIPAALYDCQGLRRLNLSSNFIRNSGLMAPPGASIQNVAIKRSQYAQHLVQYWPQLQSLDLRNNELLLSHQPMELVIITLSLVALQVTGNKGSQAFVKALPGLQQRLIEAGFEGGDGSSAEEQ